MAEAVAIVGLVASIASLIELSATVVSRLDDFTSKTSDIPESFRSLLIRLPLLKVTLQRIQAQAEAGHLPGDVTKALEAVVDNTSEQVSAVQICLLKTLPPDGSSKLERAIKALRSLAKEDRVQQALEKIHRNNDILVLYQTTRHVDTSNRIIEELSKLNVVSPLSKSFGVCLGQAPQIAADAFVGRTDELQNLKEWLSPKSRASQQRIVSIVGMGGMGKTQLSLAYVRDCGDDYSSVFWVNAKDESSLRQSMVQLSTVIFRESAASVVQDADDEQLKGDKVRQWLSEAGNDQWLLIYDNYDDPSLPGVRSPTGYDIRPFFPARSQGSIIITSRCTRLTFSKQLRLQKLKDINTSAEILSQRSGLDLSKDGDLSHLARRLDGLPLALATAGTYIGRAGISCDEYLRLYNSAWIDLIGADTEELLEYEARTMSSTWTVSLDQVRRQDRDAAELLAFLAYLSNNDIWYDLIKAGANEDVPWMCRVTENKMSFQRAMSKLQDYNLVNMVASSYQFHPCLHDWLVGSLSAPLKSSLFTTALTCISSGIDDKSTPHYWVTSRRLLEHTEHLQSPRFHEQWQRCAFEEGMLDAIHKIAGLLKDWNRDKKAEQMYDRALAGREKILGPHHTSTLDTVRNLGNLYCDQGKLDAAEQMYDRALTGYEKVHGPDHTSTLSAVHDLGDLYRDQGKLDAAEQMYDRAQGR